MLIYSFTQYHKRATDISHFATLSNKRLVGLMWFSLLSIGKWYLSKTWIITFSLETREMKIVICVIDNDDLHFFYLSNVSHFKKSLIFFNFSYVKKYVVKKWDAKFLFTINFRALLIIFAINLFQM